MNFIGADGSNSAINMWGNRDPFASVKSNRNEYRTADGLRGVFMRSQGCPRDAEQWGTVALSTPASSGVSHRTAWADLSWGDGPLDFWDDFSADGKLDEREQGNVQAPMGSLAVSVKVPPRSERSVTMLITWHFPNRMTWTPDYYFNSDPPDKPSPRMVGNYYTTQDADAWEAAQRVAPRLSELERQTVDFVRAFVDSDLPDSVKEAGLFNLSTLRTQTCFRTTDGRFFGWEGCTDTRGSCWGSCTHVWNYQHATGFLFGKISRSMREVEFKHALDDRGMQSFRVNLPLSRSNEFALAAADGQMGSIMRLYLDFLLSGDEAWLRSFWPDVKRAMEFCWIEGSWDADRDGVMEGCQHNTMDVEYFGPNGQMTGWYLGALRACEEMARVVGDREFATTCRALFERGSAWMDEHLFNGEYYEHKIVPAKEPEKIAKGLIVGMGSTELSDPALQLGPGCLIDQLVGQYTAHLCGLGHLHDPAKIRTALKSIRKYNYRSNLFGHFNHYRSFAIQDEPATLMCSYPRGGRPKRPFPYANEAMTGFEYTAAVGMLQEGMIDDGLKLIEAVRSRYDGRRRNPFNEAECGHHYARAMAAWSAVVALSGFGFDARDQEIKFARSEKASKWFFSTGDAWGVIRQKPKKSAVKIEITALGGNLTLRAVTLRKYGSCELVAPAQLTGGKTLACVVEES